MPFALSIVKDRFVLMSLIAQIFLGALLLCIMSQISIPLKPVPITLQTTGVMALGLLYQRGVAIYSVATYLVLGAFGLPVLADGSGGIYHFFGPTGGYLFGFLAAILVMTTLKEYFRCASVFSQMFLCLIGTVVIFVFGISWLSAFIGIKQAFVLGFLPFLIPGFIKTLLLSVVVHYVKKSSV
jgi:biotin transport system substrate-specific component